MEEPLGTVHYAAPEILRNKAYDRSVDLWSLGVFTFVVLAGRMPFIGKDEREAAKAASRGEFEFDSCHWEGTSRSARDFVSCLLKVDASERPSADEALRHAWLQTAQSPSLRESRSSPWSGLRGQGPHPMSE